MRGARYTPYNRRRLVVEFENEAGIKIISHRLDEHLTARSPEFADATNYRPKMRSGKGSFVADDKYSSPFSRTFALSVDSAYL